MEQEDGPRQRAAETKRRRTRIALMAAVIDLLSDEYGDPEKVGVDAIAEAAGLSTATLYNHFDSRQELIEASFAHLMSPVYSPIFAAYNARAYHVTNVPLEVERFLTSVARLACGNKRLTAELFSGWLSGFRNDWEQPGQALAHALRLVTYGSSDLFAPFAREVVLQPQDVITLLLLRSCGILGRPESIVDYIMKVYVHSK